MNNQPRYDKEEFARRGDAIYEEKLRPTLEMEHRGKFVAIDIETGAYEVDENELTACDGLLARVPNAQIWLRRIGFRYVHRFGELLSLDVEPIGVSSLAGKYGTDPTLRAICEDAYRRRDAERGQ